jgi:hypothetical protein
MNNLLGMWFSVIKLISAFHTILHREGFTWIEKKLAFAIFYSSTVL